jgi:pimeloyl-ACP methyl ester carboxylesterase
VTDLLLLHGALGASAQFAALAPLLADRFRVHAPDFEGHGAAPSRGRPFAMTHFAENVLAHLDAHGIERANVFGYSMGGYAALHLAATHPERVAAIATLGTKFVWDPATAAREAGRLDPAVIRTKVPRFAEALAERHAGAGGWERVLSDTAALLRDLGERPPLTPEVLATIPHRVRAMVGDRDATVSVEETAAAYRSLPAGELAVLPRTPHPLEQVDAARLASALIEFFD